MTKYGIVYDVRQHIVDYWYYIQELHKTNNEYYEMLASTELFSKDYDILNEKILANDYKAKKLERLIDECERFIKIIESENKI